MKFYVITASYNYADIITNAIESVLSKTYKDWELIIVDDGSTDNSVEVIKNYTEKYSNIRLYEHPKRENKGLTKTIQLGLEHARGEYIAFLESDDCWENNYLEEKLNILNKYPETKFIFNDVKLFGDENLVLNMEKNLVHAKKILSLKAGYRSPFQYFFALNIVPTFSSVIVEKNTLLDCNFDSPLDSHIDLWLWIQISRMNRMYYIDKKLTNWMIHPHSYLNLYRQNSQKDESEEFYEKMLNLLENLKNTSFFFKLKLKLIRFFIIPKINKIFRGLIRKIYVLMEE